MELQQQSLSKEELKLTFEIEASALIEICLFNEIGHLVYNYCDHINQGPFHHQIPIKNFPGGTYLLRIAFNGNTSDHEIINL